MADNTVKKKPKLNMLAPFGVTGYGITALNVIKELNKHYTVAATPIGSSHVNTPDEAEMMKRSVITNMNSFDNDATCLKIYHQYKLQEKIGRGKYVAFPIFELNKFKDEEIHQLKYPDELIVTSKWAQGVIKDEVGRDSTVAPLGVDTDIFSYKPTQQSGPQSGPPYIFFNAGKWEVRKGHDILVDMFNEAFSPKDNVQLWMMPNNIFLKKNEEAAWINKYKNSKLGDRIAILPPVNNHNEVANVIKQIDCGIFPSRAEGWNLELLETMAMGKHVITTNYSAHTEFCTKKNSHLVEIDNLESAYDGKWFFNQGDWAAIRENQKDQFISHMRDCYNNRKINNEEGVLTGQKFSWANCASKIMEAL